MVLDQIKSNHEQFGLPSGRLVLKQDVKEVSLRHPRPAVDLLCRLRIRVEKLAEIYQLDLLHLQVNLRQVEAVEEHLLVEGLRAGSLTRHHRRIVLRESTNR